jgi:hypothetical protein
MECIENGDQYIPVSETCHKTFFDLVEWKKLA